MTWTKTTAVGQRGGRIWLQICGTGRKQGLYLQEAQGLRRLAEAFLEECFFEAGKKHPGSRRARDLGQDNSQDLQGPGV